MAEGSVCVSHNSVWASVDAQRVTVQCLNKFSLFYTCIIKKRRQLSVLILSWKEKIYLFDVLVPLSFESLKFLLWCELGEGGSSGRSIGMMGAGHRLSGLGHL